MYFIKEALSSFRKNIVQSIAAVTTVGLCLVVIGLILMVMYVGGEIIEGIEKKVEIEIFFDNPETIQSSGRVTARMDKIQEIENTVRAWSEVSKVRYVSKEQALDKFKKDFQYNPEVIQNIEGNPLPDSLRVSLKNPRKVDTVANRLKTIQYVKDLAGDLDKNVQYGKDTVKRLFAVTRWVSIAAGGFATLLIFVSLVLITNTIRLAIFARRKEIGIMRLVGASNWFIRWPFILEGMFEGFIGASVAILILVGVWRTLFTNLASGKVLAFLSFQIDQTAFIKLILLLALSGAVIGSAGSFIALRRFLKV